jgi:hypothetical protein
MTRPRIRHIALNVKDRDAVAESWIRDVEGNRVDVSEHGWPV